MSCGPGAQSALERCHRRTGRAALLSLSLTPPAFHCHCTSSQVESADGYETRRQAAQPACTCQTPFRRRRLHPATHCPRAARSCCRHAAADPALTALTGHAGLRPPGGCGPSTRM